jgi:hypothetical protein
LLPYIITKQSLSDFAHIDTEEEGVTRKESRLREGCYHLLKSRLPKAKMKRNNSRFQKGVKERENKENRRKIKTGEMKLQLKHLRNWLLLLLLLPLN